MILSDVDLRLAMRRGLVIDPLIAPLQPASIDIHLGADLLVDGKPQDCLDEGFVVPPGMFLLGTTVERVVVPNDLCAMVQGRSTLGRLGLIVETAGFVDPGFAGELTLELYNVSSKPLTLTSRMGIAQLIFWRLTSPAARPYGSAGLGSKYQGQAGPTQAL